MTHTDVLHSFGKLFKAGTEALLFPLLGPCTAKTTLLVLPLVSFSVLCNNFPDNYKINKTIQLFCWQEGSIQVSGRAPVLNLSVMEWRKQQQPGRRGARDTRQCNHLVRKTSSTQQGFQLWLKLRGFLMSWLTKSNRQRFFLFSSCDK